MATTKRPNTMGKEKSVLPSSPSNPTIPKRTTITRPTITTPLSKSVSPSLNQTPRYLKPKLTSHSQSPKQSATTTTGHASQTETLNRRGHSFGRTPSSSPSSSSSNLSRQRQPPPPPSSHSSRLHNVHLCPGPRLRAAPPLSPAAAPSPLPARRASVPVSFKPVTDRRTSKTLGPRVVKTQPLQNPKLVTSASGVIPKRSGVVMSNKKVNGGGRAPASSTKAPKSAAKRVRFEAEKQAEKVEDIFEVEKICEIEGDVKLLTDIEFEDEKVISIVEEEMQTKVGIAEQEEEEKRVETNQHVKEEQNTNVEEISNNESKTDHEDQAATEAEEEGINVTEENHNENFKGDDVNIEEGKSSNNNKVEESITVEKQQEAAAGAAVVGKMERNSSMVSNGLIEETACRLQETSRRNKVRALAGAFQTVIDHQTM